MRRFYAPQIGILDDDSAAYAEGLRTGDVITSIKTRGPGFRVIVPMELGVDTESTGRKIMVDMGYVPEKWKNLFDRPDSVRTKKRFYKDKVVGVLRWPNETDSYTPPPDKERGIWFARDVEAMAAALGTEPVLIVAESHPDRLIARGVPSEFVVIATDRLAALNAAWEAIEAIHAPRAPVGVS